MKVTIFDTKNNTDVIHDNIVSVLCPHKQQQIVILFENSPAVVVPIDPKHQYFKIEKN
jgi:hypothetical protein